MKYLSVAEAAKNGIYRSLASETIVHRDASRTLSDIDNTLRE